jgi:hypothetical protein
MYPNAPFTERSREVNAWDDADFRAAVEATNKSQMYVTDTSPFCHHQRLKNISGVVFLALSLREAGYHVAVNAEACATLNTCVASHAVSRMQAAGIQVINLFLINGEFFRD